MWSLIIAALIVLNAGCNKEHPVSTTPVSTTPVAAKGDTLFDLQLYTDKQVYKTTDKITIWSTLEYVGSSDEIKIWHGDPYINYAITEGKDFSVNGITHSILTFTVLEKGKLYRHDYIKSGGFSEDDPKVDFWKNFYAQKDLCLPEGEYTIRVYCDFSLTEDVTSSKYDQSKEIKIKVLK